VIMDHVEGARRNRRRRRIAFPNLQIHKKTLDKPAACDYEERQRVDRDSINLNLLRQFNVLTTPLI
jgi:hypothetical protein